MTGARLPTFEDVRAAAGRLDGLAVRTPVIVSPTLDDLTGGRVLLKAEPLQRTGSFKFRGAYNRLVQLTGEERSRGVVAWSSGNHAQGVAAASKLLGVDATVVMPADAPAMKTQRVRAFGAEIVPYDRAAESREEIGARIAAERDAVIVPPFDDPHIIAGQGTVGLELGAQTSAMGARPDIVLVPCGGGGLTAGCALALTHLFPEIEILSVEPEGFDDHARSFRSGVREKNDPGAGSMCDALLAPMPGEITFEINRRLLSRGLAVTDADVARAMRFAFEELKIVVEPGGAVALAALLAGRVEAAGRCVGVVLSGGNVDGGLFAKIVGVT